jgi:isopenicillin N synthase-like dioxygenase
MLELWTHGIYKATPHRVKNQGDGDRLSLPFFFDPNWNSTLEKIPRELLREEDL